MDAAKIDRREIHRLAGKFPLKTQNLYVGEIWRTFKYYTKYLKIEILDKMNSARLLEPLVFGGGTMLLVCHELNHVISGALGFLVIKNDP